MTGTMTYVGFDVHARSAHAAAIDVIAEQGLGAPTSRIAKLAGVAEGTLFTYFDTKDDLLNQIYLELKAEMREVMMTQYPKAGSLQTRARHVWRVDGMAGHLQREIGFHAGAHVEWSVLNQRPAAM